MSDPVRIVPHARATGEPAPAASAAPSWRGAGRTLRDYLLATRPAFLGVTLIGVLLGLACAWADGVRLDAVNALLTVFFALAAHAGANVVNDYHDMATDAVNTERLFPFTGGSRYIQNGVLTPTATARLGYGLLLAVIPAGLWLTAQAGGGLLLIGLGGLLAGWAYSAPPLRLAARGLGELAIVAGWLLVVLGADYVQRRAFAVLPLVAGLGHALLIASVLYINQFPDATADARTGKRTLVARLGRSRARWGYPLFALAAALTLLVGVGVGFGDGIGNGVGDGARVGILPAPALLALAGLLPAIAATHALWPHAENPAHLRPAITRTLLAAHLYGIILAATLVYSGARP